MNSFVSIALFGVMAVTSQVLQSSPWNPNRWHTNHQQILHQPPLAYPGYYYPLLLPVHQQNPLFQSRTLAIPQPNPLFQPRALATPKQQNPQQFPSQTPKTPQQQSVQSTCKEEWQDECGFTAEHNRQFAIDFYNQVFTLRNFTAVDVYYADDIIQHNPLVADGKQPFLDNLATARALPNEILRSAVERDHVYIHVKTETEAGRPQAVMEIYRLRCRKIVEHWDVIQVVPDNPANSHPLF